MSTPPCDTTHNDWSPDQYLLFRAARNRPIHDLLTFLGPAYSPGRIIDLGCGPGNSTELLAARFPHAAHIAGVDSSPAMLARARATLPGVPFSRADVRTYVPDPPGADLLFANAVFHWLRAADRIPTVVRLLRTLAPGTGVLALQVPDNFGEPSHRAMREAAAAAAGRPWSGFFSSSLDSSDPASDKPELDPIEPELAYYDALAPHCRAVETWTTRYVHVLDGHADIVEWVRGTGLQPFLNRLPPGDGGGDGGVRAAFLDEYRRRLEKEYPRAADGKVLLAYPRRFVVAFR